MLITSEPITFFQILMNTCFILIFLLPRYSLHPYAAGGVGKLANIQHDAKTLKND